MGNAINWLQQISLFKHFTSHFNGIVGKARNNMQYRHLYAVFLLLESCDTCITCVFVDIHQDLMQALQQVGVFYLQGICIMYIMSADQHKSYRFANYYNYKVMFPHKAVCVIKTTVYHNNYNLDYFS